MWKLKRIYATNIVSFRELDMEVTSNVATMIFGQNLDNDNQKCNGSGKSSLIEAIAFGITGDTLRKVKVEDIINDKAEDATVQLMFVNDSDGLMFTIDRSVGRKSPQRVECHLIENNCEVHVERTVQPSVTDYNKYILSELGIAKDELYSSFILCKNHYQSFLDASDKNKKEIINRFSNGALVDDSIERLDADILPIQQQVTDAELHVSKIKGKIEAINDELNNADAKKEEAKKNREAKIEEYKGKIAQKRAEIRSHEEQMEKAKVRRNDIRKFDERMQNLENGDNTLEYAYEVISKELADMSLPPIKDYVSNGRKYSGEIDALRLKVKSYISELADCEEETESLNNKVSELSKQVELFKQKRDVANTADNKRIADIEATIEKLRDEQRTFHSKNRKETVNLNSLNVRLNKIEAMLRGSIRCPMCGGEFVLNAEKSIVEMQSERVDLERQIKSTEDAIEESAKNEELIANKIVERQDKCLVINGNINDRNKEYQKLSNGLTTASVMCDNAKAKYSRIQSEMQQNDSQISALSGKIQNLSTLMYDEVFSIIDGRMSQAKDYIDDLKSKVKFAEGQIEQFESAIEEVRNQKTEDIAIRLEASRRQYENEFELAEADLDKIRSKRDELVAQRDLFMEFKSHLANQKIDAIAAVTNEFLELIGSDIRLQLEGFRKLKSGKVRDKITVKILRNGVDCGAFEKFSGGERARVYLANILAMQKITNSNCDEGKGLDLLIEDEILDCSDESGMMSFCDALNELGVTSMLVTQVPVSESYPYKLLVTKMNGESKISA